MLIDKLKEDLSLALHQFVNATMACHAGLFFRRLQNVL